MVTATVRSALYALVDKRARLVFLARADHTYVVGLKLRMDGKTWKGAGRAAVHPLDMDKEDRQVGYELAEKRAKRDLVDQLLGEKPSHESFFEIVE